MQMEIAVAGVTLGLVCHGNDPLSEFINSADWVFIYDSICLKGRPRIGADPLLVAMGMGDRVHDASSFEGDDDELLL